MRAQRQISIPRPAYPAWAHSSRAHWVYERPLRQLLASNPTISPASAMVPRTEEVDWKADDHWTAVTSYMAGMYFPNEG